MLCLRVPELKVLAALFFEQLLVAAELDEPAAVEHRDLVAKPAGGQAVGDEDGSLVTDELVELGIDLKLRDGIERRGRLVEHDDGRVLIQRAGYRDLLLFAAGEIAAFFVKLLADGDRILALELV